MFTRRIFVTLISLIMLSAQVYAENIFPYANNGTLNSRQNIIKTKGCTEYISLPSRNPFNPLRQMSRAGIVTAAALPLLLLDPYVVQIDGINYVMVVDRNDKNWSKNDLLGIDDPKENRFESLIKLNSDGDYSKVTSEELKRANIRFVRMTADGTLMVNSRNKDYDLKKIDYIDIINLKRTANSEQTGIFGHFTVYLKTTNNKKRVVVGNVTYDTDNKIEYLFK